MAKRIIVGVDGSAPSLQALRWAAWEAHRRNAEVVVVTCYSVPVYGSPEGAVYPTPEDLEMFSGGADEVIAHAAQIVSEIDPKLGFDGVKAMSPAATAISDAARAGDEIAVGATGHTGILDGLLGSVALSVVHRSRGPVIIVPATTAMEIGPTMRKLVVGVDGSAESLQALEWAYNEALVSDGELTAVHGWIYPYERPRKSNDEPRTEMQLDAMEELKSSLESLGIRLTRGPVQVHARLIEQSPAEALLEEAADADLVVVGSRGRGAIRATLLGSVSRTVAQHAPCPVAVIRQPAT
jgi:nucleotide-binding universal stress UspA family protein